MMDVWVQKLLRHVTPLLRELGKEFPPHPPPPLFKALFGSL